MEGQTDVDVEIVRYFVILQRELEVVYGQTDDGRLNRRGNWNSYLDFNYIASEEENPLIFVRRLSLMRYPEIFFVIYMFMIHQV